MLNIKWTSGHSLSLFEIRVTVGNKLEGYAKRLMINKVLEKIFKNWQVTRIAHNKVERQFSSLFQSYLTVLYTQ